MKTMDEYLADTCETVDDRTFGQKVKDWLFHRKMAVQDFFRRYPKETLAVVLLTASGVVRVLPKLIRARNINEEERIKEEYVYDRSLGHYWKLKRPLSNDEWREIENRKANGEKLGDILESLKILK